MDLDHVFLFVPSRACAERRFAAAGLRATFSRVHPGQGTTNLCAFLDDMFIELLWLDGSAPSQATQDLGLIDRARGQGIAPGIGLAGRVFDADLRLRRALSARGQNHRRCTRQSGPPSPAAVSIPRASGACAFAQGAGGKSSRPRAHDPAGLPNRPPGQGRGQAGARGLCARHGSAQPAPLCAV